MFSMFSMFNMIIMIIFPFLVWLLIMLIGVLGSWGIIRFFKNKSMAQVKNIDKTIIFRDIPCFNEIKIAYWLLYNFSDLNKSELNNRLMGSYLLYWYKNGFIEINSKERLAGLKNDYLIDLKNGDFLKDNSEGALYAFLKRAAKSNNILEKNEIKEYCSLDENRWDLRRLYEEILKDAEDDLRRKKLITIIPEKNYILLKIKRNYKLSEEILTEYQNLIGLENFLKDYSNMKEKEHIDVHLWEKYLIFANLLGIADKVREQFYKIYPDSKTFSKAFGPSFDDSLVGRMGIIYKTTKLQLTTFIFCFLIFVIAMFGGAPIVKTILLCLFIVLLIASVYIPFNKYLKNKKVKEMYSMTEAKIIDYDVYKTEEYDHELGKEITTTSYHYEYEFYANDVKYIGYGWSKALFPPRKGKKIKIYFNQNNPSKNETKAEHNKYLTMALMIGGIITLCIFLVVMNT